LFIVPFVKDNPVRRIPWVVLGLIVVNTALLIATWSAGNTQALFMKYGFTPAHPELRAVMTSMFLHAGFWHLAGNMFFLWMFGNQVENAFGHWFFAAVYLVCGFAAAGLHYLLNLHSAVPCVGASGAISGIVGAFAVLFPRAKFDLDIYLGWWHVKTFPARTWGAVGAWVAEQFVLGLITQATHSMGIAFWAHVGGFLAGMLIAAVFLMVVPRELLLSHRREKYWYMQDHFNREKETITQLKL
jgi:membrane associated rhomboid family serine protease